jgi:hypothetical protein
MPVNNQENVAEDADNVEMTPTEYRENQEARREREELNHALRNFADHFGAEVVFEQARAIYLEMSGGQAESDEKAAAASWASLVQTANPSVAERQKRTTAPRKVRRGSPALEDAKRLLGG